MSGCLYTLKGVRGNDPTELRKGRWLTSSNLLSLIGEKVDIHAAAIRNRIWSEIVSRVEEKRDE